MQLRFPNRARLATFFMVKGKTGLDRWSNRASGSRSINWIHRYKGQVLVQCHISISLLQKEDRTAQHSTEQNRTEKKSNIERKEENEKAQLDKAMNECYPRPLISDIR